MRGVLNAGHRQGGQIIRPVGDDHEPRQFSTWTPTAIAMIGRVLETLEDRSVSIALRAGEQRRRYNNSETTGARPETTGPQDYPMVRRQPEAFARPMRILTSWPTGQPTTGDLYSPVRHCGRDWPSRMRAIAAVAENKKPDQSKRTMVLSDIRDFFSIRADADRVRSGELTAHLAKWKTVLGPSGARAAHDASGPCASARTLWDRPRHPSRWRMYFKGYLRSDFTEAFAIPDQAVTPSQPNNDGIVTFQGVSAENNVTVAKT